MKRNDNDLLSRSRRKSLSRNEEKNLMDEKQHIAKILTTCMYLLSSLSHTHTAY